MTEASDPEDQRETFAERLREVLLGPKDLEEATVTRGLVLLSVGVYAACVLFSFSPRAILQIPQDTMLLFGANLASLTVGDRRLESLLASVFLHFDVIHLTFNMIALRSVGPFVERSVGKARYFPLVLGSGIVASATSARPPRPTRISFTAQSAAPRNTRRPPYDQPPRRVTLRTTDPLNRCSSGTGGAGPASPRKLERS